MSPASRHSGSYSLSDVGSPRRRWRQPSSHIDPDDHNWRPRRYGVPADGRSARRQHRELRLWNPAPERVQLRLAAAQDPVRGHRHPGHAVAADPNMLTGPLRITRPVTYANMLDERDGPRYVSPTSRSAPAPAPSTWRTASATAVHRWPQGCSATTCSTESVEQHRTVELTSTTDPIPMFREGWTLTSRCSSLGRDVSDGGRARERDLLAGWRRLGLPPRRPPWQL